MKLKTFIVRRKRIAGIYDKELSGLGFELPLRKKDRDHIYFRYIIRVKKNKAKLIQALRKRGIHCAAPVYRPLHQFLNMKGFPVADQLMKESVSIPIYPSLKDKEIKYIVSQIKHTRAI